MYVNKSFYVIMEFSGVQDDCTRVSPVHCRQACGRPFGGPGHSQMSFQSTQKFHLIRVVICSMLKNFSKKVYN